MPTAGWDQLPVWSLIGRLRGVRLIDRLHMRAEAGEGLLQRRPLIPAEPVASSLSKERASGIEPWNTFAPFSGQPKQAAAAIGRILALSDHASGDQTGGRTTYFDFVHGGSLANDAGRQSAITADHCQHAPFRDRNTMGISQPARHEPRNARGGHRKAKRQKVFQLEIVVGDLNGVATGRFRTHRRIITLPFQRSCAPPELARARSDQNVYNGFS